MNFTPPHLKALKEIEKTSSPALRRCCVTAAAPLRSGGFCLPPYDPKTCGALKMSFGASASKDRYRIDPSEQWSNDGAREPVALFRSGSSRPRADQKGHLEPLPVAVDVIETDLAQPPELNLDSEQAVRRICILEWFADRGKEGQMDALRRRGHMLEVGEDSAGFEEIEDLAIKRVLSLVLEVVDGKRGNDNIETPERGQRLGQVVL